VFNIIAPEGSEIAADHTRVTFDADKINVYADDWRITGRAI
jgi:glycerol transport system ATP-binding protein